MVSRVEEGVRSARDMSPATTRGYELSSSGDRAMQPICPNIGVQAA